jgi:hypothetical protein
MAGEVRLIISKGGRVKILDKAKNAAGFTEKLAKDLGQVEERHKAQDYTTDSRNQQVKQH